MILDTRELATIEPRLHSVLFHFLDLGEEQTPDVDGYALVSCSVEQMAEKLDKSRRTVVYHIRELERTKFVRLESCSPGRLNVYKVLVRRKDA